MGTHVDARALGRSQSPEKRPEAGNSYRPQPPEAPLTEYQSPSSRLYSRMHLDDGAPCLLDLMLHPDDDLPSHEPM